MYTTHTREERRKIGGIRRKGPLFSTMQLVAFLKERCLAHRLLPSSIDGSLSVESKETNNSLVLVHNSEPLLLLLQHSDLESLN